MERHDIITCSGMGFSFLGAMRPQNLQVDIKKMYDRSQSGSLSYVNFSHFQTDMRYSGIPNSIRKKSRRSWRKRQQKQIGRASCRERVSSPV